MSVGIRIGAVDWRHAGWAQVFYPADMPDEWQLTFYASQYNCVFLPEAVWRELAAWELQRWCEEVHARFVFLLESAGDDAPASGNDKIRQLPATDAGIVWFDAGSDLKALAAEIRARDDRDELFLLSRDGNLAQMERVNTLVELMGY